MLLCRSCTVPLSAEDLSAGSNLAIFGHIHTPPGNDTGGRAHHDGCSVSKRDQSVATLLAKGDNTVMSSRSLRLAECGRFLVPIHSYI